MPSTASGIVYPAAGADVSAHSLKLLAESVEKVIGEQLRSYFCSLKTETPRPISPHAWTQVRFDAENRDDDNWHASNKLDDQDSALITPSVTKVGLLSAMAQFGDGAADAGQISVRFNRNPFVASDTTATQDFAVTAGGQYRAAVWPIILKAGQPLAFDVWHDASTPLSLTLAEFKIWCPPGSDMFAVDMPSLH